MITELKIIQPFFVLSSNVYLKRYAPGSVISHFYKFKCTVPSGRPVMVVPDGSTDIIFECDPERPSAEICGTLNKSTPDIFRQGKTYFGVRFLPGGLLQFHDLLAKDLADQRYGISVFLHDRSCIEAICCETDFERQIRLFMTHIFPEINKNIRGRDQLCLMQIISQIHEQNGQLKMTDLEKSLHYTKRHISRLFTSLTGVSIKRFSRYLRFQSAMNSLNSSDPKTLSQIAAECGYYDHTHFQKEFREFSSMSPGQFHKLLQASHYYDHLIIR